MSCHSSWRSSWGALRSTSPHARYRVTGGTTGSRKPETSGIEGISPSIVAEEAHKPTLLGFSQGCAMLRSRFRLGCWHLNEEGCHAQSQSVGLPACLGGDGRTAPDRHGLWRQHRDVGPDVSLTSHHD